MGEVIRKSASAIAILADLRTTLQNARQHGEAYRVHAEEKLAATLALGESVQAQLRAASQAAEPLVAAVDAENLAADKLLGRIADDLWNDVGRPRHDPALDILLPGGIAYYADGDVSEQPERMELFAGLLRSGIHPRLDAAKANAAADQISAAGAQLRSKVEAAAPARRQVTHLSRMQTAIARTGQIQLALLKRQYRADGMSEAEIHRVIPDRPQKSGADKDETPAS
jgi:hypothetical protein